MDRVFPPGPAKDFIVIKCVDCHGLAQVVIGAATLDETALAGAEDYHLTGAAQVSGLSKPQADIIFKYLHDGFFGKPIPELPAVWVAAFGYY